MKVYLIIRTDYGFDYNSLSILGIYNDGLLAVEKLEKIKAYYEEKDESFNPKYCKEFDRDTKRIGWDFNFDNQFSKEEQKKYDNLGESSSSGCELELIDYEMNTNFLDNPFEKYDG